MIESKNWQNSQAKIFNFGCIISIISSIFVLAMVYPIPIWQRILLLIGVNALIFLVATIAHRKNAGTIEKIFYVEIIKAAQIVEYVLNSKHIPFQKSWDEGHKVHFQIKSDDIEMFLRPYTPNRRGIVNGPKNIATLVKIRSTNVENEILVKSLKRKLDDGFSPKGLEE